MMYTNFLTPFGVFRYKRLFFGLDGGPGFWNRLMQIFFGDLENTAVYFDDILSGDSSVGGLLKTVSEVISRCFKNNLKINGHKFQFGLMKVPWLGRIIGDGQRCVQTVYLGKILDENIPKSVNDIRRMTGMLQWLSPHIPRLSELLLPFRQVCKKSKKFTWTPELEKCYTDLIHSVVNCKPLQLPDFKK